jgi:hypothetical protein
MPSIKSCKYLLRYMFEIRGVTVVSYFHAGLLSRAYFASARLYATVEYATGIIGLAHKHESSPGVRQGDHRVTSEPGPGSSLRSCYVELDLMFVEMDGARISIEAQTNVRPASSVSALLHDMTVK